MTKDEAKKRLIACGKYISIDMQNGQYLKLIAELLIEKMLDKEEN